jgi:hypothetical protein
MGPFMKTKKSHKAKRGSDAAAQQDTPGRPTSASSRQQTQPDQGLQSGSAALDSKANTNRTAARSQKTTKP